MSSKLARHRLHRAARSGRPRARTRRSRSRAAARAAVRRAPRSRSKARGAAAHATVLAAPSRPAPRRPSHRWGVFAPLYALHDRERPAAGDSRLAAPVRRLGRPARRRSGRHAAAARDVRRPRPRTVRPQPVRAGEPAVLERGLSRPARDRRPRRVRGRSSRVPAGPNADLVALAARTRAALEPRARSAPRPSPTLRRWLAQRPDVDRLRAVPATVEGGGEDAVRYHAVRAVVLRRSSSPRSRPSCDGRGQSLYLDFPVGSHRDGLRRRARGARCSCATPRSVRRRTRSTRRARTGGSRRSIRTRARRDGHAYLRACLDAHFRFARDLRIDHVMGLHRLWFIPPGAAARAGAYVRYAGRGAVGALCIEAHRHRGTIVGENLGTVPRGDEPRAARPRRARHVGRCSSRRRPGAARAGTDRGAARVPRHPRPADVRRLVGDDSRRRSGTRVIDTLARERRCSTRATQPDAAPRHSARSIAGSAASERTASSSPPRRPVARDRAAEPAGHAVGSRTSGIGVHGFDDARRPRRSRGATGSSIPPACSALLDARRVERADPHANDVKT